MLSAKTPSLPTTGPNWIARAWGAARSFSPSGFSSPKPAFVLRVAADLLTVNGALALAFVLRYAWAVTYERAKIEGQPIDLLHAYVDTYVDVALALSVVTVVVFAASGLYSFARTYRTGYKALVIVQAVTFAFVLTGLIAFLAPARFDMPRSVLVMTGLMAVVLFLATRLGSAALRHLASAEQARSVATATKAGDGRRTVLVIGGAGYIGSALLPKLLAEGCRVRVLDLFLYGTDPIAGILDHPSLELVRADFRQVDPLVKAMRDVDAVVHLGGIVGDPACAVDEELTIDVNLAATRLIAEAAKGYGIKRMVFASTCSVYGASEEILDEHSRLNPLSLYARSKIASEKVLLQLADDAFTPTIVRFGTIHGLSGRTRFDLVVNLLAAKAVFDGQITVHGGDQWRPFLHVDDAARAVQMLLRMPLGAKPEVFNVGANQENYTIGQVGEIVKRHVPAAELVCSGGDQDKRDYRVDFTKIERMVGFKTRRTVEDGVRQVVSAIRAGSVTDYQDVQYSNFKFMTEVKSVRLAPPSTQWAHELISAPPVPATLN